MVREKASVKWRPGVFYWSWCAGLLLVGSGLAVLNYPEFGVGGVLVSFVATALAMCFSSGVAVAVSQGAF